MTNDSKMVFRPVSEWRTDPFPEPGPAPHDYIEKDDDFGYGRYVVRGGEYPWTHATGFHRGRNAITPGTICTGELRRWRYVEPSEPTELETLRTIVGEVELAIRGVAFAPCTDIGRLMQTLDDFTNEVSMVGAYESHEVWALWDDIKLDILNRRGATDD